MPKQIYRGKTPCSDYTEQYRQSLQSHSDRSSHDGKSKVESKVTHTLHSERLRRARGRFDYFVRTDTDD